MNPHFHEDPTDDFASVIVGGSLSKPPARYDAPMGASKRRALGPEMIDMTDAGIWDAVIFTAEGVEYFKAGPEPGQLIKLDPAWVHAEEEAEMGRRVARARFERQRNGATKRAPKRPA
jgi:hypothetical protein